MSRRLLDFYQADRPYEASMCSTRLPERVNMMTMGINNKWQQFLVWLMALRSCLVVYRSTHPNQVPNWSRRFAWFFVVTNLLILDDLRCRIHKNLYLCQKIFNLCDRLPPRLEPIFAARRVDCKHVWWEVRTHSRELPVQGFTVNSDQCKNREMLLYLSYFSLWDYLRVFATVTRRAQMVIPLFGRYCVGVHSYVQSVP